MQNFFIKEDQTEEMEIKEVITDKKNFLRIS